MCVAKNPPLYSIFLARTLCLSLCILSSHQSFRADAGFHCDVSGPLATEFLSHIWTLLTPIGWDKGQDGSFAYSSLDYLTERFLVPLQKRNVNSSQKKEEWDDMTDYARRYINLVDSYRVIWCFSYTESGNWTNILALVALLFCLPASNGKVERIFSRLKSIKSMRHTSLGEEKLDGLLRIYAEL